MATPSALEQEQLELLNRMRLNPQRELDILVDISGSTVRSGDAAIQAALNYYKVDGEVLAAQWAALVAAQPLAWSGLLADAATGHNQLMVAQDKQAHQLPGELSMSGRANAVGWRPSSGGWLLGENVYAYAQSMNYGHAGFAIDWGPTATGIQTNAGHRGVIMNNTFREVGISVVHETDPSTRVGPYVITQDFGYRAIASNPYVLGVAFNDLNGDGWYQAGEGRGGITVTAGSAAMSTWESGGYQIQHSGAAILVTFSGGDLAAAISVTLAASSDNLKLDLVGDVLRSSGSTTLGSGAEALVLLGETDIAGVGNAADNFILGSWGDNRLEGRDGNDTLDGAVGNDTLSGDAGNDLLNGGAGNDSLSGGSGDDLADGGDGDDSFDTGAGDDMVWGGAGSDRIFADLGQDTSFGGDGSDMIFAEDGDDVQFGGDGGDLIDGGAGNDRISGMQGDDWLEGDDGNDSIDGGDGRDMISGGKGLDVILGGAGDDGLLGMEGDDWIDGGEGNDWIEADGDRDFVDGGSGDDIVNGESADDTVWGGSGNDLVLGGAGRDVLRGGAGDDDFADGDDGSADILNLTIGDNGSDLVAAFEDGVDHLQFAGFGISDFAAFLQAGGFIADPSPDGSAGRLVEVGLRNPGLGTDIRLTIILDAGEQLTAADLLFV